MFTSNKVVTVWPQLDSGLVLLLAQSDKKAMRSEMTQLVYTCRNLPIFLVLVDTRKGRLINSVV